MSQSDSVLSRSQAAHEAAEPGVYRFLGNCTPLRAPNTLESELIAFLVSTHLRPTVEGEGHEDATPPVSYKYVRGHMVLTVHPLLVPSLEARPLQPVQVGSVTFYPLPADKLDTSLVAVWFRVRRLRTSQVFLAPSGSAADAPLVARNVADEMGGTLAFWWRTGTKPLPTAPSVVFGHVGVRFACLVPANATLVHGLYQDVKVVYEKHPSLELCGQCHSLGHERSVCRRMSPDQDS